MNKFLFGAATAAHQVEGNNINSDVWALENIKYTEYVEKSGVACDHYNRYKEDIDLLKDAGLNSYRFSIEWARIEKIKGSYDESEMNHYIEMIDYMISKGIEPVVTLHHFSSPKWLITEGGWENKKVIEYFKSYTKYVVEHIKDKVKYICTINEANMGLQMKVIIEKYKREYLSKLKSNKNSENQVQVGINLKEIFKNMKLKNKELTEIFKTSKINNFVSNRSKRSDLIVIKAHNEARNEIKKINKDIKVGITLSLHDIQVINKGFNKAKKMWSDEFSHYIKYLKDDDFIGVQNYTRMLVSEKGIENNSSDSKLTEMGYEYCPESLKNVIKKVNSELNIPIIVTENGIATSNDKERIEFIDSVMNDLNSVIKDNNVIGYFYWSLLDNFEWQKGFSKHFGLIEVDRNTMERRPKDSLYKLGNYSKKFNNI